MKPKFVDLFNYNEWANQKLFSSITLITDEEFNRDLKSSFSSVRETLLHVVSVEWIWLKRWQGESPKSAPHSWDTSSVESIKKIWEENNHSLQDYIQNLADFEKYIAYSNVKGDSFKEPFWALATHLVNHSTYHRGQLVGMMRQLGRTGISTDYILYYREKAG